MVENKQEPIYEIKIVFKNPLYFDLYINGEKRKRPKSFSLSITQGQLSTHITENYILPDKQLTQSLANKVSDNLSSNI